MAYPPVQAPHLAISAAIRHTAMRGGRRLTPYRTEVCPMSDDAKAPVSLLAADAPGRGFRTNHPESFASRMAGRDKRPIGDLFGLTNFGVNIHAPCARRQFGFGARANEAGRVRLYSRRAPDPVHQLWPSSASARYVRRLQEPEPATPTASSTRPRRRSSPSKSATAPPATRSITLATTSRSSRSTGGDGRRTRMGRLTKRANGWPPTGRSRGSRPVVKQATGFDRVRRRSTSDRLRRPAGGCSRSSATAGNTRSAAHFQLTGRGSRQHKPCRNPPRPARGVFVRGLRPCG
jgi:hypothetical protein